MSVALTCYMWVHIATSFSLRALHIPFMCCEHTCYMHWHISIPYPFLCRAHAVHVRRIYMSNVEALCKNLYAKVIAYIMIFISVYYLGK